jgi:hypothetical protein
MEARDFGTSGDRFAVLFIQGDGEPLKLSGWLVGLSYSQSVRKRIVIGVLAIITVGALVYVVFQPRKGSIEWHKREYLAARSFNETWVDRLRRAYHDITNTPQGRPEISDSEMRERVRHMVESWDALISLGYLKRSEFYLTHQPKSRAARFLEELAEAKFPPEAIWSVEPAGGPQNAVVVYARSTDLPVWRDFVSRADGPARTDAQMREALYR